MSPRSFRLRIYCLTLLSSFSFISCKKPETTYYEVPKEDSKQPEVVMPANHPPIDGQPGLESTSNDLVNTGLTAAPVPVTGLSLVWTSADHWIEGRSSSMRLGSYTLSDNPSLDISVTRFPGDVGGLLSNVNRWRSQIGLAPTTLDVLKAEMEKRIMDPFAFEIVRLHNPDSGQKMVVALLDFEGFTWFFKMMGPEQVLDKEEGSFFTMVDSVSGEQS